MSALDEEGRNVGVSELVRIIGTRLGNHRSTLMVSVFNIIEGRTAKQVAVKPLQAVWFVKHPAVLTSTCLVSFKCCTCICISRDGVLEAGEGRHGNTQGRGGEIVL